MSDRDDRDYARRRIAEAKIAQFQLMKEMLQERRKKDRIHYTVHTDFNALRQQEPTREEKIRSFDDDEER